MNQLEVEQRAMDMGAERARHAMVEREQKGRAGDGPYANRVYREFVLPVAEAIKAMVLRPGRGHKYALAMAPLGSVECAFVAVRTALARLMANQSTTNRHLSYQLGLMVYSEVALSKIAATNPELLWMLSRDLDRRGSVKEDARAKVMLRAARNAGIDVTTWDKLTVEGVGSALYWLLIQAGMLTEGSSIYRNGRPVYREVFLSAPVMEAVLDIRDFVAETRPLSCPTIEPPKPWTSLNEGGFHGPMRRVMPFMVQTTPAARPLCRDAAMPTVYAAVNALQRTRFRVNQRVLDVAAHFIARGTPVGEYPGDLVGDKPIREAWMEQEQDTWSDREKDAFVKWKADMRDWYTRRKIHREATGRIYTTLAQGREFKDFPTLHFVHFADTRGRLYAVASGLHPQGSDLQKALLEFAVAEPIEDSEQMDFFLRHGPNKFGFDKVTKAEQVKWVRENQQMIRACAANPLECTEWTKADSPFGFLAWCFEFAEVDFVNGPPPVSRLPIGMDGTCNGLQHFSAMLRDPVGAEAVNLAPGERPQDVYGRVSDATKLRLERATEDEHHYRSGWLGMGINRKWAKQPVMTTPYGVTRRTATQYVADLLLSAPNPWEQRRHLDAANYLMGHMWPAIADVVVAARSAMSWLSKAASRFTSGEGGVVLSWRVPSGFPAHQSYAQMDTVRIETVVYGHRQIRVGVENDKPDAARHRAGLPPNFVHSLDASHLHMTVAAAAEAGITDMLMVHDDYACHARYAPKLARILREQFVKQYRDHDPLADFAADHPEAGEPPAKGTFNIEDVLRSEYVFN